jgi:uncharacterized protein YcfJ
MRPATADFPHLNFIKESIMSNSDLRDLSNNSDRDLNRDLITGEPGSHPIGTGVGAALGGAAAGAAAGTVAGPIGTVIGGAVGAIVGGLAGKGVAEKIDPTREDAYWRENYKTRSYVDGTGSYDDYGPAYALGVEAQSKNPGRDFDDIKGDLSRDWNNARGQSSLDWSRAQHATRDAWNRISDSDRTNI